MGFREETVATGLHDGVLVLEGRGIGTNGAVELTALDSLMIALFFRFGLKELLRRVLGGPRMRHRPSGVREVGLGDGGTNGKGRFGVLLGGSVHEKADNLLELSTGREVIKVHIEFSIINMAINLDVRDRIMCFSFGRRGRQDSISFCYFTKFIFRGSHFSKK